MATNKICGRNAQDPTKGQSNSVRLISNIEKTAPTITADPLNRNLCPAVLNLWVSAKRLNTTVITESPETKANQPAVSSSQPSVLVMPNRKLVALVLRMNP